MRPPKRGASFAVLKAESQPGSTKDTMLWEMWNFMPPLRFSSAYFKSTMHLFLPCLLLTWYNTDYWKNLGTQ